MPRAIIAGVFLSSYLTWRPSLDIMFTLSDALFLIGLAILLHRKRIPLDPFQFLTPIWIAALLLLISGLLVGSLAGHDPLRWPIVASQYLFAWMALPLALLGRGTQQTERMLKAFVWGVFMMNLFGAIVYFTYTGTFQSARELFGLDFLSGGRRLGAFTSDANWNGAVLSMAVPMAIFLRAKRTIGQILATLLLAVLLLGVMLTASFTAFMCSTTAVVIFVVIGGLRPDFKTTLYTTLLAGAVVPFLAVRGVLLPKTFVARVGNAVSNGDISEAGTFDGRMRLIREAWGLAEQHLLVGVGADQYRVVSLLKAPVHNMYLLLWVEGGLISLIGWVLMVAVPIAAALRAYPRDRLAAALTFSVTVTFIIASTASPHMYARLWSVPLLLALAVSIDAASYTTSRGRKLALARKATLRPPRRQLASAYRF